MAIDVSRLSFSFPDGTTPFSDLSFKAPSGKVTAVVGPNGVGKSTLLQVVAGQLEPTEGVVSATGSVAYMPQNPGFDDAGSSTVGDALALSLPSALRVVRQKVEAGYAEPTGPAGLELGDALDRWGTAGGYEIEGAWDRVCRDALNLGYAEARDRPLRSLSGGQRKRVLLGGFLAGGSDHLLLDEPDNFLDLPGKAWLQAELAATSRTVLIVSHDRALLSGPIDRIVCIEQQGGSWVHGGSYTTFPEARRARLERLARDLTAWRDEERRLYRHMRVMKQRAALNDANAPAARAAETRWAKFRDAGQPEPPPPEREIKPRFVGSRGGSEVVQLEGYEVAGLVLPFDLTVCHGERVLLLGDNGVGKSSFLRSVAAAFSTVDDGGDAPPGVRFAPAARVAAFSQDNQVGLGDGPLLEQLVAAGAFGNGEEARRGLGRYGLAGRARHQLTELSGGQQARIQLLLLERGHPNVLLLDEPTDNLDLDSIAVIEEVLADLDATQIAISHDRTFARLFDRWVMFDADGVIAELPDLDTGLALASTRRASLVDEASRRRGIKVLTNL